MYINKFNLSEHFVIFSSWLATRKAYEPDRQEMPELGWIAFENTSPIAAVFLRRMEGGSAMIDGLTTDPEALPSHRNQAIDLLIATLLKEAEALKIKRILAFSVDENTVARSQKHGFAKLPHTLLCR